MADNVRKYGFRWWSGNTSTSPTIVPMTVATSQDHQDDTSTSVLIREGDPLKLVSTGGVNISLTANGTYGIAMGFGPVWDGSKMAYRRTFPNTHAWGTNESRRPWVQVGLAKSGIWEIDVDDATTATTYAGYIALINENCDHVVPGHATIDPVGRVADPRLDISTHHTSTYRGWRVVGISSTVENKDFSGANVKLLVVVNESQEAGAVIGDGTYTVAGV